MILVGVLFVVIIFVCIILIIKNSHNPFEKEYILCSAILRKEPAEEATYTDNHKCILGYRHCDIMRNFNDLVRKDPKAQGFFTSKGRFVDRRKAYKIAIKAKQIKVPERCKGYSDSNYISWELYSEDLY